jgi:4-amino-4-deoxy-L-arabinose transferase-like glycosyltransferase
MGSDQRVVRAGHDRGESASEPQNHSARLASLVAADPPRPRSPLASDVSLARPLASTGLAVDRLSVMAVVASVVVGAIVRLVDLGAIGFNSDEAVYAGQAAALAGNADYSKFFAIFRAHPLLVQFLLSMSFQFGVSDVVGRLVSVFFGLAAIPLMYLLGRLLFTRAVGVISAVTLALLQYHVTVSRQVLLDGTETTLFLLSMYLLGRYAATSMPRYLYVAAVAGGLTFLAKETAILVLPVAGAFLLMTPSVKLGWRRIAAAIGIYLITISPYPISIAISGASGTAREFLLWQLLRRPNHTPTFYAEILPGAIGIVLLLLAIAGIVMAVRVGRWQDRLLLAWILVPLIFFQVWPVKGYQYLLPIVPAAIVLAARVIEPMTRWLFDDPHPGRWRLRLAPFAAPTVAAVLVLSVAVPTIAAVRQPAALGSLAGTGGLPGGREAGRWINENLPEGAAFMTIGPTLSNVIQFYGHRRSQGLSVSPNPLHRNPAYDPIRNPDDSIRTLRIQYIAYDIWSASRSNFFAAVLMDYVAKYHGQLIYEQVAETRAADGSQRRETVIRIYEVRP